jgi:lipoyl(octanoyl) transferase
MKIKPIFSKKTVPYEESFSFMEDAVSKIANDNSEEIVWFLEHEAILTAGTSAREEDVLGDEIPIFKTNRGGKHTLHAPGQRVVYLMINLKKRAFPNIPDPRRYILDLEEVIINSLAKVGIKGEIREGRVGVWVVNPLTEKEEKIAAIGVRFSKGVTWHGIAINVKNDLSLFKAINPCGITEFGVCSLESLGVAIEMEEFDKILLSEISKKWN